MNSCISFDKTVSLCVCVFFGTLMSNKNKLSEWPHERNVTYWLFQQCCCWHELLYSDVITLVIYTTITDRASADLSSLARFTYHLHTCFSHIFYKCSGCFVLKMSSDMPLYKFESKIAPNFITTLEKILLKNRKRCASSSIVPAETCWCDLWERSLFSQ